MKKHDEGYVLAFVMVVVLVLAAVVSVVLPVAERNATTQAESIKRMQDKYAAEGKMEIVLAKLNAIEEFEINVTTDEKTEILDKIKEICPEATEETAGTEAWKEGSNNEFTYAVVLSTKNEDETAATICKVLLKGKISRKNTKYKIKITGYTCQSYETGVPE